MLVYISSGHGINEVCRALWHFYIWLETNYSFELIHKEEGGCKASYCSLLLQSSDERFYALQGTHLWQAASPFRPKHKRKNWYFSLWCYDEKSSTSINRKEIIYQTMKSPKNGGQHVNTTSSGVRAIYPRLNLEAISFDQRSQHRNKQIALMRLLQKVELLETQKNADDVQKRWSDGKNIERGKAVKRFKGEKFQEQDS